MIEITIKKNNLLCTYRFLSCRCVESLVWHRRIRIKKKRMNDRTTHAYTKKRRTHNSSFSLSLSLTHSLTLSLSLSLLRYSTALAFRFSRLNKTVRCCRVIVPSFYSLSSTRARAHKYIYIYCRHQLCFFYKQIYIFYRDTHTHYIFRVVIHNSNQTN